jgi:hypothetical protein
VAAPVGALGNALEANPEAESESVVDKLKCVVVLVTLLVLEEVGEPVTSFGFQGTRDPVGDGHSSIGMRLRQVDRASFLAKAVHRWQPAACDKDSGPDAISQWHVGAESEYRNW